ncbi:MAG: hypothetical protein PVJ26_03310 [Anaerolineae bacterium]|jgi:hypothetical protein
MAEQELPLPWKRSVIAVIPGLLATMGWISTGFSARMLAGLVGLVLFLLSAYWWNKKRLPGWSLMAVGMLASIGLVIASGVIGGLLALTVGVNSNLLVLLAFLVISVTLLRMLLKGRQVSPQIWGLFSLVVLCQLAVRIKYFTLFGISWSVTAQWLIISLYAAMVGLLLPVIFGLFLSQRYGLQTMLFVIGMIYTSYQILIDVNLKVSDQIGHTGTYVVYQAFIPFLITVLAPLWYMRARAFCARIAGTLSLVGLAVFINLLVVGISYAGQLPVVIWISFIPYTASILLTLVLAYLLYGTHGGTPNPTAA